MSAEAQAYIAFAGGVILSILVPYLIEWANERVKFSARYIIGRLLAAGIALIPFITGMVTAIASLDLLGAFVYGWFASDVGRQGQKVYDLGRLKFG